MFVKTVKLKSSTITVNADEEETSYIVGRTVTIDTSGKGIAMNGDAKYRALDVAGTVHGGFTAVQIDSQPSPFGGVQVHVRETARLTGNSHGMVVYGQGHLIDNAGDISSEGMGIYAAGIDWHGGKGEGINLLVNHGVVRGGEHAITASYEYDKVLNSGRIFGDVSLGEGDDIFVFKAGKVTGAVEGGLGDDIYVVRKAGLVIVEKFDEGIDSLHSSVSIAMPDNVERLHLTGKADIDATGSSGANRIYGNAGANRIDGGGGMDHIDGGGGNDILTGGASADEFRFAQGTGKDIVTDFTSGLDEIQLGDLRGAKDFDDMLANHISEKGGDVWIAYGHDVVIVKNTAAADLKVGDFDFG